MDESDDPRFMELGSLEAIYPEIRHPDAKDPFAFEIELPVEPAAPVTVTFPAASAPAHPGLNTPGQAAENGQPEVDSLEVSYLPSLRLQIRLPEGYPVDAPPKVQISTTPQWLTKETIKRLEDDGPRLWDEIGRDMVAFTYIDHIQRAAEDVFGTITAEGTLEVDPEHKLAVLDHDIKSKKAAFERETFDCGVCLGKLTYLCLLATSDANSCQQTPRRDPSVTRCSTAVTSSASNVFRSSTMTPSKRAIYPLYGA
jgi:E3 ubiquitin-protein ligase RNF14